MKKLGYFLLIIAFAIVTFFGLGPVLFADGVLTERLMTLGVVILLYVILIFIWQKISKR